MEKRILIIILIIGCLLFSKSVFSQEREPIFCFPDVEYKGKKTDGDLNDYLEYEVCNSSKKKIIGIIVSYCKDAKSTDIVGNSLANKEICRIKTSIDYFTKKLVKVYLPYSFEGYIIDEVVISRFIFSDGSSKDAYMLFK